MESSQEEEEEQYYSKGGDLEPSGLSFSSVPLPYSITFHQATLTVPHGTKISIGPNEQVVVGEFNTSLYGSNNPTMINSNSKQNSNGDNMATDRAEKTERKKTKIYPEEKK
jgi:hypothetical protein